MADQRKDEIGRLAMLEKLLTVEEAAQILGVSADEVEMLSQKGLIPAYRIGGMYLRFKKEQIQKLRGSFPLACQISLNAKGGLSGTEDQDKTCFSMPRESNPKPTSESQSRTSRSGPAHIGGPVPGSGKGLGEEPQVKYTPFERVKDFLFYNDFYIISIFVIIAILFFIFKAR